MTEVSPHLCRCDLLKKLIRNCDREFPVTDFEVAALEVNVLFQSRALTGLALSLKGNHYSLKGMYAGFQ